MATRLAVLAAAGAVAGTGLLSAGAGAASAAGAGTTGPGTWSFDLGDGQNAITTTSSPPTVSFKATVQPPINAPGQPPSVFSNKTRTIPVKYTVQKCTTPGASTTHYPGTLTSDGTPYPGLNSYSNVVVSAPAPGATVGQITNLVSHFQWAQGTNQAGSMRWTIGTPAGNVDVYYGEPFNTGGGTVDSGTNMIADANSPAPNPARVDVWTTGNNIYDTWANSVTNNPTVANEPVSWIALIVDSGTTSAPEQVTLSDVAVTVNGLTDTYTPGDVSSGGGATTCATDTTDPMWLSLSKTSGATPAASINESTITDTQGDLGGQFRQVDGMYIYNLPMSQLTDLTATYTIGISPNSDGSSPISTVQVGLK